MSFHEAKSGTKTMFILLICRTWESYGTQVILSNEDVTSEFGCQKLIAEASNLGPVGGIFNLAAVLRDLKKKITKLKLKTCQILQHW